MNYKSKIVTETPLSELWTDNGPVDATRGRSLIESEVREFLSQADFVIAEIGQSLNWIKREEVFKLWKSDLNKHLINYSDRIILDDFPDNYAYLATEWIEATGRKIILLEKFH